MKFENLSRRFVVLFVALFVVAVGAAAYLGERQSASARSQQLSSRAGAASETFLRSLGNAASMASILSFADPARAGCSDALAPAFEAMGFHHGADMPGGGGDHGRTHPATGANDENPARVARSALFGHPCPAFGCQA